MIQVAMFILVVFLVNKTIKQEKKEYKEKHGMTKQEFIAMRKVMNPQFKTNFRQKIQDLSKN
jgi:hypothetical protein